MGVHGGGGGDEAVWVGKPWGVAVGDLRQGSARIMLLFSAWERPPTGVCYVSCP